MSGYFGEVTANAAGNATALRIAQIPSQIGMSVAVLALQAKAGWLWPRQMDPLGAAGRAPVWPHLRCRPNESLTAVPAARRHRKARRRARGGRLPPAQGTGAARPDALPPRSRL